MSIEPISQKHPLTSFNPSESSMCRAVGPFYVKGDAGDIEFSFGSSGVIVSLARFDLKVKEKEHRTKFERKEKRLVGVVPTKDRRHWNK